ncbi:hypothetical protein BDV40DRAFT_280631 [Aspergillus tamarii]|uniref:Uncharacterized protein n=1 Tax=Aspergillus tamarii TaxID=41984 RepID=A0A5N6UEH4_ASPTM|nr:hypothetical protein BDV40DRAFT_280631 [Aspergillus tamarii]
MGLRFIIPEFIWPIETQLPGLNSAASFTVFLFMVYLFNYTSTALFSQCGWLMGINVAGSKSQDREREGNRSNKI